MNTYVPIFRGLDARGSRKLRTDTHTHTRGTTAVTIIFEALKLISILILENATALGSRIPPHAVLLQVNDNTPVKLKIIFAI